MDVCVYIYIYIYNYIILYYIILYYIVYYIVYYIYIYIHTYITDACKQDTTTCQRPQTSENETDSDVRCGVCVGSVWEFPKIRGGGYLILGVLIIRILLFRVLNPYNKDPTI